jgi:hypothetical protein
MKFLQIGASHPRNEEFFKRICANLGHEYHHSGGPNCIDRGYDLVWSPGQWFNPDRFPNSKILYGPQFWVFPNPSHPMFSEARKEHRNRCIFTCLSPWVQTLYHEFMDISKSTIPFVPLPFGVNIPPLTKKDNCTLDCIVYFKNRDPLLLQFATDFLQMKGLRFKVFTYGSYTLEDYCQTLKKTRFVIWIGTHESQGFALEECMASNTPLYIYTVKTMKEEYVSGDFYYKNYKEPLNAITASYWDSSCGEIVSSQEEFCSQFDSFIAKLDTYTPWEFVTKNLSDEVCFKRLCAAFGLLEC